MSLPKARKFAAHLAVAFLFETCRRVVLQLKLPPVMKSTINIPQNINRHNLRNLGSHNPYEVPEHITGSPKLTGPSFHCRKYCGLHTVLSHVGGIPRGLDGILYKFKKKDAGWGVADYVRMASLP